jgi:excinuclease ABC subunit C
MRFSDQTNLFELELYPRCLRGEMNRCLAPCAGAITRGKYVAQLNRARAFLSGRDDAPLADIDQGLRQAVSDRRFEHAAHLRDLQAELVDLRERLLPQRDLLPVSFIYKIHRRNRLCWLVVHEATVMKVAPAPRDPRLATRWRTRLDNWRDLVMPLVEERDGGELQILASWFRRHPLELQRVMDFDSAHQVCSQWACGSVAEPPCLEPSV